MNFLVTAFIFLISSSSAGADETTRSQVRGGSFKASSVARDGNIWTVTDAASPRDLSSIVGSMGDSRKGGGSMSMGGRRGRRKKGGMVGNNAGDDDDDDDDSGDGDDDDDDSEGKGGKGGNGDATTFPVASPVAAAPSQSPTTPSPTAPPPTTPSPTMAPPPTTPSPTTPFPSVGRDRLNEIITCISVIDESQGVNGPSASTLASEWEQFRNEYPERPFCLLQPEEGIGGDDLKIPNAFTLDGNANVTSVSRDFGVEADRSDWFDICNLADLRAAGIVDVAIFIDDSGSIEPGDLDASRALLCQRLEEEGLNLVGGTVNNQENWIRPFLRDFTEADNAPQDVC